MADLIIPNFNLGICPIVDTYEDTNVGTVFDKEFDLGAAVEDDIYIYFDIENKLGSTNVVNIRINQVTSSTYNTTRLTGDTIASPTSNYFYALSLVINETGSALYVVRSKGIKCCIHMVQKMNDNSQSYMLSGSENTITGGIRYVQIYTSGNAIGRAVIGRVDTIVYDND